LFRRDASEPYAKIDADFLSKGGNEVLADVFEFFAQWPRADRLPHVHWNSGKVV